MIYPRTYYAKSVRVVSGDDLVLMVDLGVDGLYKRTRVRLRGVDVPTAFNAPADSLGSLVRNEVDSLVSNRNLAVDVYEQSRRGWIVVVRIPDNDGEEKNLNDYLIGQGYVFSGRRD